MRSINRQQGFTLVEMAIVLVIIGLLLGGILFGLEELLRRAWPSGLCAALVLLGWVLLTGALPLDGFLDSCDGLLGGRTAEDRLRIMRDERVGAFAVVGAILLLLIKYVALTAVQDRLAAYILAAMLGRWGMVLALLAVIYLGVLPGRLLSIAADSVASIF